MLRDPATIRQSSSDQDPDASFRARMRDRLGIDPGGPIKWDRKTHRFPGKGKNGRPDQKKCGWYVGFEDRKGGQFGDHSQGYSKPGFNWQLNNGKNYEPPSEEERARWKAAKTEQDRRKRELQERAAVEVNAALQASVKPKASHPYLKAKGISSAFGRLKLLKAGTEGLEKDGKPWTPDTDELLVPMQLKSKIVNVQRIHPDGAKFFWPKAKVTGASHIVASMKIDKADPFLYLTEGWATAWSISECSDNACIVAFGTSGLAPAMERIRASRTLGKARVVIAADNDRWSNNGNTPNPGVSIARLAAKKHGAEVAIPDFVDLSTKPTDFNDLHQLEGAEAVLEWLDPARAGDAVISDGPEPEPEELYDPDPGETAAPEKKPRKPKLHRLADNQLAALLPEEARERFVYDPTRGWFHASRPKWDWRQYKAVGTLHRSLQALAKTDAETAGGELLLGNPTIQGAITFVKYDVEARPPWDGDPMLAGLPGGGVLDLSTGEARASRRRDFVTRRLGVVPDPKARPPELFLGMIRDMTSDMATADWLLAWLGYVLTGHTIVTDHAVPLLIGDAGSGKTTLLNLLAHLLGGSGDDGYAAKFPADVIVERLRSREKHPQWMVKCLNGPRLAIGTEIPERSRLDVGMFKEFTGGEAVTANQMRMDSITFQPSAKLIFYGNTVPAMPGWDPGLQRRLVITNCTAKPKEERDEGLYAKLVKEGPAILHYLADQAAQGYGRHLEKGLWLPAPSRLSEDATLTVLKDHDVLGEAIRATLTFTGSELSTVTPRDLRQALKKWYDVEGHNTDKVPPPQAIASEIRAEAKRQDSHAWKSNRHGRPWLGISLAQ